MPRIIQSAIVTSADMLSDGVVTTAKIADLGVTTAKIASGAVTTTEILDGTILNADVSTSAAIAYSKLALTGGIVNADVSASAAIVNSKLALTAPIARAFRNTAKTTYTDANGNYDLTTAANAMTTDALVVGGAFSMSPNTPDTGQVDFVVDAATIATLNTQAAGASSSCQFRAHRVRDDNANAWLIEKHVWPAVLTSSATVTTTLIAYNDAAGTAFDATASHTFRLALTGYTAGPGSAASFYHLSVAGV